MRTRQAAGMVALVFSVGAVGCARINTQVVDKPRVDQELPGNRGYLKGSGPAPLPRKATRQMIQTDIELPTVEEMNPWRKPVPVESPAPPSAPAAPMEAESWEQPAEYPEPEMESAPPESETIYTVRSGDTLEKISKEFYGTTRKSRRIYDANRNILRSPDRVYPGQKLVIPSDAEAPAGSEGGQDFK